MINIVSPSRYKVNKKNIQNKILPYLDRYNIGKDFVLNVIFVGKRKMTEIALTYKGENVALPVLSFSYLGSKDSEDLLGEIFICYPQAILLSSERNKKVDDMIIYLIEHGIQNLFK